jgi:hypothetical protein
MAGATMAKAAALLGTWRMTSWRRKAVATGEVTDAMGSNPIGYIAYHADGRMMALVVSSHRPKLKGALPTDEEKAALFDSMLAYSASYTLEDDRVIHHVDAAWNPAWGVSDLTRPYALDGDTLVIQRSTGQRPNDRRRGDLPNGVPQGLTWAASVARRIRAEAGGHAQIS